TPLCTLKAVDGIPHWNEIDSHIKHWRPTSLGVGTPLNMDDSEQLMTHCARKFANRLENHTRLPVYAVDERLSTWEAKNRLQIHVQGTQTKKAKKKIHDVNAMAAAILLEQWIRDNPRE